MVPVAPDRATCGAGAVDVRDGVFECAVVFLRHFEVGSVVGFHLFISGNMFVQIKIVNICHSAKQVHYESICHIHYENNITKCWTDQLESLELHSH